jgi:exodeoxyribonuclease VII large subunit
VVQVVDALRTLDRDPEVDVVVLARGGGSVEDLLPFSDEALVRAVAASRTPVVSAIGHETDTPLIDLAADVRASTPTDAAKRVVPDVEEERRGLGRARDRLRSSLRHRLDRETAALRALRTRPVLAEPTAALRLRAAEIADLRARSHRSLGHSLDRARSDLGHTRAQIRALSPAATLDRGYAIVRRANGSVLRSIGQVEASEHVGIRLTDGELGATVD